MKFTIPLILILLTCFSCINQHKKPSIQGTWTMCSIVSGNTTTVFNVCPTFFFGEDVGIKGPSDFCYFKYQLDSTTLKLKFLQTGDNVWCAFGEYDTLQYTLSGQGNDRELIISTFSDSTHWILSKREVETKSKTPFVNNWIGNHKSYTYLLHFDNQSHFSLINTSLDRKPIKDSLSCKNQTDCSFTFGERDYHFVLNTDSSELTIRPLALHKDVPIFCLPIYTRIDH